MKRIPQRLVQLAPAFRRGCSIVAIGSSSHNIAPLARDSRVMTRVGPTINPGPQGMVGWKSDGTSGLNTMYRSFGKIAKFEGAEGLTLMYVMSSTDTGAVTNVAGTINTGTNYSEGLAVNRESGGTLVAGALYAEVRQDTPGGTSQLHTTGAASPSPFDGQVHCIVVQWRVTAGVTAGRIWVDGIEQATTILAFSHAQAAGLSEFSFHINNRNNRETTGSVSFNGTIYLFGRWLTNAIDGRSLSENPQQIFADEDEDEWAFAAATGTFIPLIGRGPGMSLARKGGGIAARH